MGACILVETDGYLKALQKANEDMHTQIARALAIKPEDHATTSRDYGRGFAEAIRRVREALERA